MALVYTPRVLWLAIAGPSGLRTRLVKASNDVDTWQYANIKFGFDPFENLSGSLNLHLRSRLPHRQVQLHRFLYYGFSTARGGTDEDPEFPESGGREYVRGTQQLEVYRAWVNYDAPFANFKFLYREGHYHWRYEGDFFNLYQETFYYEEYDQYEQVTPYGFFFTGKKEIEGLKVAAGPEVALGSAPGVILKYRTPPKRYLPPWLTLTLLHQEDIAGLGFGDPLVRLSRLPRDGAAVSWGNWFGKEF